MSYALQMPRCRGATWFHVLLLPISQWALSTFSVPACPKKAQLRAALSLLPLPPFCPGQGMRLTWAAPHQCSAGLSPSGHTWEDVKQLCTERHSTGRQHCRERSIQWLYGIWLQDFWRMSSLMPAAARIHHVSETQWKLPCGSPCRSGYCSCLA